MNNTIKRLNKLATETKEAIQLQQKFKKQLEQADLMVAQLQAKRIEILSDLPKKLGFDSKDDLIAQLESVGSKTPAPAPTPTPTPAPAAPKRRGRKAKPAVTAKPAAKAKPAPEAKKKRIRHVITPEIVAKTVALIKQNQTARQVASGVGISIASVAKIKKNAGLVAQKPAAATKE